eukprot:6197415-Pleurochrysis_carterae.AAC.1
MHTSSSVPLAASSPGDFLLDLHPLRKSRSGGPAKVRAPISHQRRSGDFLLRLPDSCQTKMRKSLPSFATRFACVRPTALLQMAMPEQGVLVQRTSAAAGGAAESSDAEPSR